MIRLTFQQPFIQQKLNDHEGAILLYPFKIIKDGQEALHAKIKVQVTSTSGIDRKISDQELIEVVFTNITYYVERGEYYKKVDDSTYSFLFYSRFPLSYQLADNIPIEEIGNYTINI